MERSVKNKLFKILPMAIIASNSSICIAQASVEPPTGDNGKTPYAESFTTGDVAPTPPPEGEPDTTGIETNPETTPDPNYPDDDFEFGRQSKFSFGASAALTVPHIINLGLETLTYKKFGASLNYGSVSRNISGVDVAMKHMDIRFRYHPWAGSFFGGIAFGQHSLVGQKSRDISITNASGTKVNVPTKVKVTATANYIAPHIGWFAIWEPGFTMGLDLGWMVPTNAKSTTEATFTNLPDNTEATIRATSDFAKATSDVDDAANSYAKKSMPFISMIRVGWMF